MLSWFVDDNVITKAINQEVLINDKMVNKDKAQQHSALADDLNFNVIKKYFTTRGWKAIKCCISSYRKTKVFNCNGCFKLFNKQSNSMQCDKCLMWYHWECVALKKMTNTNPGFVVIATKLSNKTASCAMI